MAKKITWWIVSIFSIIVAYLFITDRYYDEGYRTGHRNGVQETLREIEKTEIKSPEFTSFIKSYSENESGLFETEFIIKNNGNGSATSVQLWIESDVKIEKVVPLFDSIGVKGIFNADYLNGNKTYYLGFDILFPSQELPIIIHTKEKPYIILEDWLCAETADKESVNKLKN